MMMVATLQPAAGGGASRKAPSTLALKHSRSVDTASPNTGMAATLSAMVAEALESTSGMVAAVSEYTRTLAETTAAGDSVLQTISADCQAAHREVRYMRGCAAGAMLLIRARKGLEHFMFFFRMWLDTRHPPLPRLYICGCAAGSNIGTDCGEWREGYAAQGESADTKDEACERRPNRRTGSEPCTLALEAA